MENTPQPFIENQNLPTTPPPSSNKKKLAILAVVGVLILGAASYFLAGGNLFKGQLSLEDLKQQIPNLVVRTDNGNFSAVFPPKENSEVAFEVVQNTTRQTAIWTPRGTGEFKILHAKAVVRFATDEDGKISINIIDSNSYIVGIDGSDESVSRYCVSTEKDAETCNSDGKFTIAYNGQETLSYKIKDSEGRFDIEIHRLDAPAAESQAPAVPAQAAEEIIPVVPVPAQPAAPEEPAAEEPVMPDAIGVLKFTAVPRCGIVATPNNDKTKYTVAFKDNSDVNKFDPLLDDNWQWTWSNIPGTEDTVIERDFTREYAAAEPINEKVTMAVKYNGPGYSEDPIATTCDFIINPPEVEFMEEIVLDSISGQAGAKAISYPINQIYKGTNSTVYTDNQMFESTNKTIYNIATPEETTNQVSADFKLGRSVYSATQATVTASFVDTSTSSPEGIIRSREWTTNSVTGIDVKINDTGTEGTKEIVFIWDGEATMPQEFDIDITLTIKDDGDLSDSITKTFKVSTTAEAKVFEARSTSYLLNNKEKDGNGLINNLLKVSVSTIGIDTTNTDHFSYAVAEAGASIFLEIKDCKAGTNLINIQTLGKETIVDAIKNPNLKMNAKLDIEKNKNSQCGSTDPEEPAPAVEDPEKVVVEEDVPQIKPVEPKTDVKITMACTVKGNIATIKPTSKGFIYIYPEDENPGFPFLTWNFDDGTKPSSDISVDEGENYFITHEYTKSGQYNVSLKLTFVPNSAEVKVVKDKDGNFVKITGVKVNEQGIPTINEEAVEIFAESEVICDVPEDVIDDGKKEEPEPKVETTSSTGNMCSIVSNVENSSNTKVDQEGSIVDCSINISNISNTSKSNVTNVINNYYGSSTTDTKTATPTPTATTTKPATTTTEVVVSPKEIAATGKFEALDCYQTKNYTTYKDIPDTHYYYKFIDIFSKTNTLTAEGEYDPIIHGYAANGGDERLFGADRNITRAESWKVVTRASCFFDWAESNQISLDGSSAAKYKDLAKDFWGYSEIDALSKVGIISGYANGTIGPNNQITRAEFVKTVLNVYLKQNPGKVCTDAVVENVEVFKDADNSEWYSEIAPCSKYYKIWLGSTGNLARPNDYISRGEAMTILNNFVIASGKVVER